MLQDTILKAIKAFHLGEKHKGRGRILSQQLITTVHLIHRNTGNTGCGEPAGLLCREKHLQTKLFLGTTSRNCVVSADGRNQRGSRGVAGIGN